MGRNFVRIRSLNLSHFLIPYPVILRQRRMHRTFKSILAILSCISVLEIENSWIQQDHNVVHDAKRAWNCTQIAFKFSHDIFYFSNSIHFDFEVICQIGQILRNNKQMRTVASNWNHELLVGSLRISLVDTYRNSLTLNIAWFQILEEIRSGSSLFQLWKSATSQSLLRLASLNLSPIPNIIYRSPNWRFTR